MATQPAAGGFSNIPVLPAIKKDQAEFDAGPPEEIQYSSKLTNVEAQRIMAVLQEIQKKVQIIGLLPDVNDRKFTTVLTGNILNMISDFCQLEFKYKNMVGDESQADQLIEIEKEIKLLTRSILRYFLKNQNALMKLRYLKTSKVPAIAHFEHRLQEIKMLVFDRLRTTVQEENQKQDQLSLIIAKEQKTSGEVKLQKEELDKAKKERHSEVNKKNEIIRKLKDELKEIKTQAEEVTKKLESRSKQKEDQDIMTSKEKEAEVMAEIAELKRTIEEETKKHREEESLARKKKFKIESEVENWILKYDQDLDEKQAEIDDITTLFMEEKAHLDELQLQFNELQKEYEAIQARQKLIEQKKKEEEAAMAKLRDAAVLIQKIWRGYKVRLDIWRKKNEKKAPGKGDKKGKKKK